MSTNGSPGGASQRDKIRIAVAGCGTIAHIMHLPGIRTMTEMGLAELVAVCDAVGDKAKSAAQEYGAPRSFDNLGAMLADTDFDVLVNLTPIPEHFAVSLAALRAGRHVYTQKPMATSVAEASVLIDEARARGLRLACAPEHPVRPLVRTIGDLVRQGAIGKVTFAKVLSSHDGPEKHNVPRDSTWFYKPGSGPILDMGVHGLSQITAILGPVRRIACFSGRSAPVRVTTAGPFTGKKIDVEVDDNSLLMLDFGDARFAYLDATYCVPATLGPRMEIYGTTGALSVSGGTPHDPHLFHYRSDTKEWTQVAVPAAAPVRDLGVLHMVECLRAGTAPVLSGEHARHLVEVMDKAPVSAAEGRSLALETTF